MIDSGPSSRWLAGECPVCQQGVLRRIITLWVLWRGVSMFGVTDLGVFIAGTIAIVLLPGPNSIYVLTVAARSGVRQGYAGAVGVFLGDATLMLLTALGAASVLKANPFLFNSIRWVGACYLAYLGIKLIVGAWRAVKSIPQEGVSSSEQVIAALKPVAETSAFNVCRKALLISLFNPKAILFFLSFFVQFVDPTYPYPALSFGLLAVIVQCASFVYLSTLIFAGAKLARAFGRRKKVSALLNSTVGLLFIAFGLRLAS